MVPFDAAPEPVAKQADPPDPPHLAFLRKYQRDAVRAVSTYYAEKDDRQEGEAEKKKRAIVVAVTGAGKGSIAVAMIIEAISRGLRVMFVVHRTEIIIEIERRLRSFGIEKISLITGDSPQRYDPAALIHLANISSVRHRVLPGIDLLLEDEAHRVLAPTYLWLREQLEPKWICGFSATPRRLDKKPLCLAYNKLFIATQPSHLLENGWLARARVFSTAPKTLPDVDGIKEKGGDFDSVELSKRFNTRELVGDIVEHWKRRASDLLTIVFACDIAHSKSIVEAFREAGVSAEHVDGELNQTQRKDVMARMLSGEIQVIVNAALWLEGIDMPELKCCILARPTKSITVYLQSVGRVMRPHEGMNCVILDHAGNVDRHKRLPQADYQWSIQPPKKRKRGEEGVAPSKRCPSEGCGAEVPLGARVCPECSFEFPSHKGIDNVDGELVEVSKQTAAREATEKAKRAAFNRFWLIAYKDGFDKLWVLRSYAERFDEAIPDDWTPPERPNITYTETEKRTQLNVWIGVAQRQKMPYSWVTSKYQAKFMEDPSALDAKPAAAEHTKTEQKQETCAADERVELEF